MWILMPYFLTIILEEVSPLFSETTRKIYIPVV